MLRRELLHLGLAAPLVAGPLQRAPAQTLERRRAGILLTLHQTDPEGQARVAAVRMGLGRAGWREGVNIDIDYRWAPNDRDLLQRAAGELVAAKPDVIIAQNTPATRAVLRLTTAIPVVFCQASDPVGSGLVASLARPGGNATGFVDLEASLATKWIELLKEIAPTLRRIAFLYNPATATYAEYYLGRFRAAAPGFGIEPVAAPVHDASEIASVLAAHGRGGTGLIVMPEASMGLYRAEIVEQAARHAVPAIYPYRYHTEGGGLVSYGIDLLDQYRRAGEYASRILRGEKPADLPVQQPTKFELTINLRTARQLGLTVPPTMLVRADHVIE